MKQLKLYLTWIFLFILANVVELILRPLSFIWAMVRSKDRLRYIKNCTESIDQNANAFGAELFTDWWVKPGGYRAGNKDETLSSMNGKNERLGTLTEGFFMGTGWNRFLHKLDPYHCLKSIEENP